MITGSILPQRPQRDLKIFVQIASYRDVDCQWTVRDLFEQAEFPDRIFIGICWQFVPDEDQDCFQIETRPDQVRRVDYHAKDARGVGFARGEAQKLLQDEDFVLQIDAHHRFVEHWDSKMIDWLYRCPSPRPVLATMPQGFTPPRQIPTHAPIFVVAKEFNERNFPVIGSRPLRPDEIGERPLINAFVQANFTFMPARLVREQPYDPQYYFNGEDILMSTRYWTSGYDFFAPTEHLTWHDWDRKSRRSHWEDHKDWLTQQNLSDARIRHLLGIELSTRPEVLADLDHYGLGKMRSLEDYELFSGIDFKRHVIHERAKLGDFKSLTFRRVEQAQAILKAKAAQKTPSHQAKLVFASAQIEVYDDFLPEDTLNELYRAVIYADHKHINTGDKISRSWRPHDGFPMRSELSVFWYDQPPISEKKPHWAYPSGTGFDLFVERVADFLPTVEHMIGDKGKDWQAFSVSSFIYPAHTGLSLHKDGRQIYSGAYTFFLSHFWDIHWGGMLIVLDPTTKLADEEIQVYGQAKASFSNVWLDRERENPHVYNPGLGQVVLPKRNRMVFINPDCLHMVTHVNEHAGDHVRMALSGFFHAKPPKW